MLYIPLPRAVDQEVTIGPLDGASFQIRLRWNMRNGWTVACSDESGERIFGFQSLRVGVDLFARVRSDERVPSGSLMLWDLSLQFLEPGFEDLCWGPSVDDPRGRCMLLYVPADELDESSAT